MFLVFFFREFPFAKNKKIITFPSELPFEKKIIRILEAVFTTISGANFYLILEEAYTFKRGRKIINITFLSDVYPQGTVKSERLGQETFPL